MALGGAERWEIELAVKAALDYMALGGAERWEIELAVEAALDHHRDPGWAPVATDLVCDMHGILEPRDRQLVREVVALRIGLETRAAA